VRGMKTFSAEYEGEWLPAEDFQRLAIEAASDPEGVEIHVKGLEHLDCTALQVLCALSRKLLAEGHILRLAEVTPALASAFALAGAGELLEANANNGAAAD